MDSSAEPKTVSLSEAVKEIQALPTPLIVLIGVSGTGKTTLSQKLIETHTVIEMDKIMCELATERKVPIKEASCVYEGKSSKDFEAEFVKRVREKFYQELKNKRKVILEGTISNAQILRSITYKNKYQVVYLLPQSAPAYVDRLKKRFEEEFISCEKKIGRAHV